MKDDRIPSPGAKLEKFKAYVLKHCVPPAVTVHVAVFWTSDGQPVPSVWNATPPTSHYLFWTCVP
jgi:hypothetical protein